MRSLRARLLAGLLALMTAVSLLAGGITYRRALHETSNLFDYQLRQMALSLRDQASVAARIVLPPHPADSDFVIQIWDIFGSRIYFSGPAGQPFIDKAILGYSDLTLRQQRWRVYSLALDDGVIQVAQPWSVREQLARDVALRVTVPLLLLLPLLALATAWTVSRALQPLRKVTAEVERRDMHSLSPIEEQRLPAEVAPLVSELNRLLKRLADAFKGQQAFEAEAAPELRSPLTALSLQLQLLERAQDAAQAETARQKLRAAIERATHLVSQLLTLARNEPLVPQTTPAPVQLDAAAREAISEVQPFADARHTLVMLDAPVQVHVSGAHDALRMLVRNLVDNAVRYSPPDSAVQVRIHAAADQPVLTVEDQGPGIPAADRERAFDRFYRRKGSTEGGTGLGLAIVDAIARRHGAHVELGDCQADEPHGLRVRVSFPRG
jgi:two-component system OmpR family sensor kinase/two-component system sensor histidine kinase QseC